MKLFHFIFAIWRTEEYAAKLSKFLFALVARWRYGHGTLGMLADNLNIYMKFGGQFSGERGANLNQEAEKPPMLSEDRRLIMKKLGSLELIGNESRVSIELYDEEAQRYEQNPIEAYYHSHDQDSILIYLKDNKTIHTLLYCYIKIENGEPKISKIA